ncbi:MAG TPA: tetratricopeptide repeat protein [Terriglobales bacterium]|nr:tetratricopeptide repeat protein [Terriglobales bacterium]
MAFGLGFNKAKVLSSAEKYVQQGKLQNAITEYQKILKHDEKDLTVLNTVGDLYARLGQNEEACNCFRSVGDAYAQQGFTVKAIAMYKKLTKSKPSLEGILKLAELYTQQGLFNDARQQYLQVAEEFLRTGELEQAVRIFQKTLEMDPENVAMKVRLAEVYVRLGKKEDAWQIFSGAAEQLRSRGQLAPAEDILQRMLTLDPKNPQALLMRGRNALEAGDSAAAAHHLEKIKDIDSKPDALKLLFQARIAAEQLSEAGVIASKLLTLHNTLGGITAFVEALMKGGLYEDALKVVNQHFDALVSAEREKVVNHLHTIIGHVRSDRAALQVILDLLNKAGDESHNAEITELLAHASVQSGDLEAAKDLYQTLSTIEPSNPIHNQALQQVTEQLGEETPTAPITTEEGVVLLEELEATAPSVDQDYSPEVLSAVREALTEAELFVSYNMAAKALGPLTNVLPRAPEHVQVNQKLAILHTRAGKFEEAAPCCRVLEKAYREASQQEPSSRYGDLARRYEERCTPVGSDSTAPDEQSVDAVEEEIPVATPAPWPTEAAPAAQLAPPALEATSAEGEATAPVQEFDLSEEWDGGAEEEHAMPAVPSPAPPAVAVPVQSSPEPEKAPASNEDLIAETVDEIRFYLQHAMRLQALAAMAKLEALSRDESLIETLRAEYETAFAPPPVSERPKPQAPPAPTPVVQEPEVIQEAAPVLQEEPEQEVAEAEPEREKPAFENFGSAAEPSPAVAASAPVASQDTLGEFVADLESALGDDFLTTPPPAEKSVVAAAAKPAPVAPPKPVAAPVATPKPAAAAVPTPPVAAAAAASAAPTSSTFSQHQPDNSSLLAPGIATAVSGTGDLTQMFNDLKGELEEDTVTTSTDQDPETHYNLGVAFREMGLLDEAIGELQKVCQIADKGTAFPHLMQTYTWLAQCFLDKGVPEAAIRWYQQALNVPNIDEETRIAVHYELASAYESAQNRGEALNHFLQVYSTNIDYRDVAERIKVLRS